jgi:Glycosyl hydrolases family 2, TIM barrel domain/Glycosyl hydrolases family 2, sugar binding domain/Glycosyl hydrolases family 2
MLPHSGRRHSLVCFFAALLLVCATPAWSAARIDLNGEWQFRIDAAERGEAAGWTQAAPAETETVVVPHTWGVGPHADHEGRAWYFRRFELPRELIGKHAEVRFEATFDRSRVWLNGHLIGQHDGGFTAYALDATGHLRADNLLAVELDNRPGLATIPAWAKRLDAKREPWYDWWHYGGIVREVFLSVDDGALIRRQQIRSKVNGNDATVDVTVFVEHFGNRSRPAKLQVIAHAPDGTVIAHSEKPVMLSGSSSVAFALTVPAVKLWRLDDPQLYRMEARLLAGDGTPLDTRSDNFGVRTIEIRDRKLYVNGDHVRLSGMTRHEESPWEGLAETRGTIVRDYDDLKALNVTLTRPVHYPQHPLVLDYADRHGILLMPEIPLWQLDESQLKDPKLLALAKQMMREMIEQAGNHPSIFAWSACNESETFKPGGVEYVKTMRELVKGLDPDRFFTYADDSVIHAEDPSKTAAPLADFIMLNQYFGSWQGSALPLAPKLERLGRLLPDKMVVISEFGLPGVFEPNTILADERRVRIIREQMKEFERHDWIGGALLWCYQDYKSHRNLWPGETSGYVDHGVVDENRQRRPSYEVWKEVTAPARLSVEWNQTYRAPTSFRLTVQARSENEIPSFPLRGYHIEWELRDDDDRVVAKRAEALADLTGSKDIDATWTEVATKSMRLALRLVQPDGRAAVEQTFRWRAPRPGEKAGLN